MLNGKDVMQGNVEFFCHLLHAGGKVFCCVAVSAGSVAKLKETSSQMSSMKWQVTPKKASVTRLVQASVVVLFLAACFNFSFSLVFV